MKSKIIFLVFCIGPLIHLSCNKSNEVAVYSVTYEVITSGGNWNGEYDFYSASSSQVLWKLAQNDSSGWKYSFTVPLHQHMGLVISASAVSGLRDSANIYLNGKLVATNNGGATFTLN
jgi:hypothetical protein